jgi:hypothetical protein
MSARPVLLFWTLLVSCIGACGGQSDGYHPPASYSDVRVFGETLISQVRRSINSDLSDQDRALDSKITYGVSDRWDINAHARNVEGQRNTIVDKGMVASIDSLSIMQGATTVPLNLKCNASYLTYLSDSAVRNAQLVLHGAEPSPIMDAFEFMHRHKSSCPQIDAAQWTATDSVYAEIRNFILGEQMKFILLHEFAHHKYGDTDSKCSIDEQQSREERADAFAFKTMMRPPKTPLGGIGIIGLFASMENFSDSDQQSDHPAGGRRMKALVLVARDYMDSPPFQELLKKQGPQVQMQWKAFLKYLEDIPDK